MKEKKLENKTLVLGIGNYLMGDEGVGIHAVKALENGTWSPTVSFLDGGTGGFHLLSYLEGFENVIVIDASLDEFEEGHVRSLKPRFAKDFPPSLSAHEIGLKDLIESLVLLDQWPNIFLIAVSIKDLDRMDIRLSPKIEEALNKIELELHKILIELETTNRKHNQPIIKG